MPAQDAQGRSNTEIPPLGLLQLLFLDYSIALQREERVVKWCHELSVLNDALRAENGRLKAQLKGARQAA